MAEAMAPALLPGLSHWQGRHDVLLCDIWGVLHNGVAPFPGALRALTAARAAGMLVVLVSNAPRPGSAVRLQLDALGVPHAAYDLVITSGDATRRLVVEMGERRLHHIGPPRDLVMFDGLPVERVGLAEAGFVVCTGLDDDRRETAADYADRLAAARARDLVMICANPDLVVDFGGVLIPCAGAIAAAYEALGGRTVYGGKPHRPIYDLALASAAERLGRAVPMARVLAIGDATRTDIAGAAGIGAMSLFITGGIHAHECHDAEGRIDAHRLAGFLAAAGQRPDAVMPMLDW
jgi:HAD superfamily hydrolase (TIGR01459 family)